jgi:succinate dehydrogenase / fumarate reductase cytochrome b subunit
LAKVVMAVTGLILVGFLVTHVASNLTIFSGPEKINQYAAALRAVPAVLWGARLVLLVAVALHIWSAWRLTVLARSSRPVGYKRKRNRGSSFASRTMRLSGILLFAFIVFHIFHFTVGSIHPDFREGDVSANVIRGFQSPGVALFYILAMGAVGLHLAHGVWSVFQSLGVTNPRIHRVRQGLALVLAVGIAGGFTLVPLAIMTGFLK